MTARIVVTIRAAYVNGPARRSPTRFRSNLLRATVGAGAGAVVTPALLRRPIVKTLRPFEARSAFTATATMMIRNIVQAVAAARPSWKLNQPCS